MMKKVLITFVTLAVAAASAATYRVKLLEPTKISGTTLKAGDYKLDVVDNKAVFKAGKQTAEATVKVESTNQKFTTTSFRYDKAADGTLMLQELKIGGSMIEPRHALGGGSPTSGRNNDFEAAEMTPCIGVLAAVIEPKNPEGENAVDDCSRL